MEYEDYKLEFWSNLIYRARYTPDKIRNKINGYMFENNVDEVSMVDEFIFYASFLVLNNYKNKILVRMNAAESVKRDDYEVFRFLQILKFMFPQYNESSYFQAFKCAAENGEIKENMPFAINMSAYTVYSSTKVKENNIDSSSRVITPIIKEIYDKSSFDHSESNSIALKILGDLYKTLYSLTESEKMNDLHDNNFAYDTCVLDGIIYDGGTPAERVDNAVKDYNNTFYIFFNKLKNAQDKSILRTMKYDVLDESLTVISENIKSECINYFKLI